MDNVTSIKESISQLEAEVNRVNRLLTLARRMWVAQGTAYDLDDKLKRFCGSLAMLYAERDLMTLNTPLALKAVNLTKSVMDLDRKPPGKNPNRRYVAKGERKKSDRPNTKKGKNPVKAKNGRHDSRIAA